MPSVTEALAPGAGRELLAVARESILHGLSQGVPSSPDPADYDHPLQAPGASFVTLRSAGGDLRGCIGHLEAHRPLVLDVAGNAFSAAFLDPRFSPVNEAEFTQLDIHISVLGPSEPLPADAWRDLPSYLQPGHHGLIIQLGSRRATFLPAVWAQLPEAQEFVAALYRKAGLEAFADASGRITGLSAWVYTVHEIHSQTSAFS
ncbi:AmmeMemoRadiSam system protein A [Thioalkalivibrio sulfidiphilus]|uniref:AMMECR1 domain-containing protein n=1 Tax=Thioalkalivibrio sulfidiphilus (strain HL-EbGR7) TaxID=396588 RepID=B8GMU2_THISH|nr:AmmeMemoRadiSam system protein A [Thioalkalivibrio sulfidiphilus]ACL73757.1 conserved hypothetical protein [Thioalkalivibrio sulfidiphilus HL-EbGr7]